MILKMHHFSTDSNLMYLIQNLTKDSTADILSYFHHLALHISEEYLDRNPGRRINKVLEWHYKESYIPYKLTVCTNYNEDFKGTVVNLYVSVNFPKRRDHIDVSDMINRIVECGLGLEGSEPLPNFNRPKTRVPAGFKRLLHK